MASGDTLITFYAWDGTAPLASHAVLAALLGSENEIMQAVDFDDTTDESYDYAGVMPENYSGGGLTCIIQWSASNASNNCVWGLAFRRIQDDAEDFDTTAHTYAFNTVTAAAPTIQGEVAYDTITFTDGADMDSVVAGDLFVLRVTRDADNASDNLSGDAHLVTILIKET